MICPSCSQAVFVLARSPLPDLALPPAIALAAPAQVVGRRMVRAERAAEGNAANGEATVAMELEELDLVEPKPRRRAAAPPAAERPAVQVERTSPLAAIRAGMKRLAPPRRWFSVPRMALAGVVVLVASTVYWQIHARKLRQMRDELVPAGRRGLQALVEGKLDEARDRLGFAVKALDALGDDFPDAERFRQAFAELDLVANLTPTPFEDLAQRDSAEAIATRLAGSRILIDAEVEKTAAGWQMSALGFVGDKPVLMDAAGLRLFDELDLAGRTRLVFGATIEKARLEDNDRWVVRFAPGSGVLLTDGRLYGELGLARDPAAMQIRERQQAMIEKRIAAIAR